MRKVLILLTSPKMGGAEKVMINIANKLDRRKFEVTFFLFFKKGILFNTIDPAVHVDYAYDMEYKSMAIALPHILNKLAQYKNYDVVVAGTEIWPTYVAMMAHLLWGMKSIAWVHTNMRLIMRRYSPAKRFIFSCLNFLSYRLIDRIAAVSEACEMSRFIKREIKVIPNSYDEEKIREAAKEPVSDYDFSQSPVILSVSRMNKVKNIGLLIKAHALLCKEGFRQRVLLIGDGEELNPLKLLAEQLGVSGTVTFLGQKDNPYPYFAKSDVYVSASFVEGFCLSGMEAMVFGMPIVSTSFPNACASLVDNNKTGRVLVNNTVEELAAAIKEILLNSLNVGYAENAKMRVKEFREENILRQIEIFLAE